MNADERGSDDDGALGGFGGKSAFFADEKAGDPGRNWTVNSRTALHVRYSVLMS